MGCFTGCFGLSSNTKRRNSTRKILPRHQVTFFSSGKITLSCSSLSNICFLQRICSYEPLLSSDPSDSIANVDSPENILSSNLRCEVESEEGEKKGTKKTRKRVRFNLNVQTFEPTTLPSRYENYCSDDDDDDDDEEAKGGIKSSRSVYPANYRYHNCVDGLDEDELGYGESDLEDEDYYTDDEGDADDEDEEEDEEQDVTPLLNPVENIAQWKAVKAKPVRRVKELMKENVEADSGSDDQARPLLMKEIIVNTSLADWLASPKTFHGNGSAKRSPIVDITNMENRSKVS